MALTLDQQEWVRTLRDSVSLEPLLDPPNAPTFTGPEFTLPGGAILLCDGGQVVYGETFGRVSPDRVQPRTLDTMQGLYSGSKAVTSCVIHKLNEEGIIDLDEPVMNYPIMSNAVGLPVWGPFDVTITFRQLISHTSGLFANWSGFPALSTLTTQADAVTFFATYSGNAQDTAYGAEVPGEFAYRYGDKAPALALLAAEDAATIAGRPISNGFAMVQEMLDAYGMSDSMSCIRWRNTSPPDADFYTNKDVGDVPADFCIGLDLSASNPQAPQASGNLEVLPPSGTFRERRYATGRLHAMAGIYSTANDLQKFLASVYTPGVYLQEQQSIDNMFDFFQGGGYQNGAALNDGTQDEASFPGSGWPGTTEQKYANKNFVNAPWAGWTPGWYILADVEDSSGSPVVVHGGTGAGGGDYASCFLSAPDKNVQCIVLSSGSDCGNFSALGLRSAQKVGVEVMRSWLSAFT